MSNDPARWASIAGHFTHGTATPVLRPSVIPTDKRDCEVFWVSTLLPTLVEFRSLHPTAVSCPDDSHGNHDVIVMLDDGGSIGVQVTELTYELERARMSQRDRYVADVLKCFENRGLSSHRRLVVNCFVPFVPRVRYSVPNPEILAEATADFIRESPDHKVVEVGSAQVRFQWVDEGVSYVPSVGGIGVDCDLDTLPRTLDMYCDAASCLREKKSESHSPWLLIWSQSFWRDKHWLGEDVLRYMRDSFSVSPFERVFFMESLDGTGYFEANLSIHAIKA